MENKSGLYVAVKYTQSTKDIIKALLLNAHNIPNPIDVDKIHTTVIYSREHADIETDVYQTTKPVSRISGYEMWKTQDGTSALVAKLDCEYLKNRHKYLMDNNKQLTYDYPEYNPHITLSYNVPNDYVIPDLPNIDLVVDYEYQEELKQDWAKTA